MSIHKALIAAKLEISAIGKNKKNVQQGFYFRGIDDVYNCLHDVLARNGIVTVPEVLNVERQERTTVKGAVLIYSILTMKYTFYCEDGSSVAAIVIGEGMDSGDKASNKAMSIAHKYALLQVFMVPTEDMVDPEGDSPELTAETASMETLAALKDHLEAMADDLTPEQVAFFDAHPVDRMTEDQARKILNKLKQKEAA